MGKPKIREVSFQVSDGITLTLYCKGLDRENIDVKCLDHETVRVQLRLPHTNKIWSKKWKLIGSVDPEAVTFCLDSWKLEIFLTKKTSGIWHAIFVKGESPQVTTISDTASEEEKKRREEERKRLEEEEKMQEGEDLGDFILRPNKLERTKPKIDWQKELCQTMSNQCSLDDLD